MRLQSNNEPSGEGDDPSDDERQRWFRFSLRSWQTAVLAGLVLVLLFFGCWLGYQAFRVKSNLEAARHSAQQARDALSEANTVDAKPLVDNAAAAAQRAREAAHSIPWSIASSVPWLGSPFKTGREIADVVYGLAIDVLQPSANVGLALAPDQLLEGGRVDVQALREAAPKLDEISKAVTSLDAQAANISEPTYLSAIGDARTQLQAQMTDISGLLRNVDLAARLAPSMMGADGPRTYFMGFQTNAEARGTGGLLGGFGILKFDNGKPTVDTLGQNTELFDGPFAPIDLGPEFVQQYGFTNPFSDIRNSNQSPHFPYAAQIWKSMWEQQSGMKVDGAIAIDPVALSYILGATGPVTMPDGEVISKDNVVELTESTVYARFPTDQPARKQYLQDVAGAVVNHMTDREVKSPRRLLDALGKAVSEGRIAVWSASPAAQQLLEQTPLAHVIPGDPAPYARVVVNNLGGNKLDYYLRTKIEYSADSCNGDTRKSTVTVQLTNTAPEGPLPDYVALAPGFPKMAGFFPSGTNFAQVTLLATTGAKLEALIVRNEKTPVFSGTERNHPVFMTQVAIPRGKSIELKFLLTEPTSPGAPRVPVQPFVENVEPTVSVPECTG